MAKSATSSKIARTSCAPRATLTFFFVASGNSGMAIFQQKKDKTVFYQVNFGATDHDKPREIYKGTDKDKKIDMNSKEGIDLALAMSGDGEFRYCRLLEGMDEYGCV